MRTSWIMIALGFCGACSRHEPGKAAPPGSVGPSFSVEPVIVVERALDAVVSLPGELTPLDVVEIYPRAQGFVRSLPVDRGSVVKKGDPLAALEAPELTSQRAEFEAKVAGDDATLDRLQAAHGQMTGAVAEHDIEVARATSRASKAKLDSVRTLEGYLLVTAPFDGVVTQRFVSLGALVGPAVGGRGTPMMTMETVAKLRLTVAIPEEQTSAVRPGDVLGFGVRAWPQRRFEGKSVRVAHSIEPKTRTMPVELDVDNADGALSSGMYATVAWHVHRPTPTLFVPESAIVQATDRTFVVRIKDGKAEPVTVQRGTNTGDVVEVFGDLRAGDTVAKRGSEELKIGTPLTLRSTK